jgi:MoxR-like ATPase
MADLESTDDVALADKMNAGRKEILNELHKRIIGQGDVIELVLLSLFVGGNSLIVGVPGLAKTLLVSTVSKILHLSFKRIQFTPDLMPADITGTDILQDDPESGRRKFVFLPGPIFANMILADEINRTPPKTQAALLEAMQEHQITAGGQQYRLPEPFFVLATQNPIEQEGTYPLPEAQLDRFLFKLHVGYPTAEQEIEVLARHDRGLDPHDLEAAGVRPVASAADLARARSEIDALTVEPPVLGYIVEIARATRVSPSLTLGVSPRGAASLLHAAKAWAWLAGRGFVTPDEVKAVAKPALRHRLQLRPEVELEGATADGVLDGILATVPAPR